MPKIWDELGMEPAVKKQNSVKNVEMCPAGFCKRSKFNTIGTGMKLLNKYKHMDMPCRTKIGVAGCRNACGSVYSKDVGVIADKTGFLVTAGGSAGHNPRMADILIKDVDEKEALKIVDKINITGAIKIKPRNDEIIKAWRGLSLALKKVALIIFTPAKIKPPK